jgi:hypothetical protein
MVTSVFVAEVQGRVGTLRERESGGMSHFFAPAGGGILLTIAVFSLACGRSPVVCAGTGVPAITVEIRDSVSGLPAAFGARLIARTGERTEIATDFTPAADSLTALTLNAGMDTPGIYLVTVEKSGYRTWTRDDVVVRAVEAECGSIDGVILQVSLQRANSSP